MRRRGIHNPPVPTWPTMIAKIFSVFWKVCVWVWKFILILWYWIERVFLILFLLFLTIWLAWWTSLKPSNNRDWALSETVLPDASFSGEFIKIKNVRNHIWTTDKTFTPGYYDREYNINEIESLYYIITPFSDRDWPAHTMLSFTFSWGIHVVISGEVRKEQGESFDALKGVLNQFELMYVIADENDVIKLRTNYRKNNVYMYPIKTNKENIQQLFRSMVLRANKIKAEPEFYNTFWNNCTTSILTHANALRIDKISWTKDVLLPAHSDSIIYNLWLINTSQSLPDARLYYKIDEVARTLSGEVDFSQAIRKPVK